MLSGLGKACKVSGCEKQMSAKKLSRCILIGWYFIWPSVRKAQEAKYVLRAL